MIGVGLQVQHFENSPTLQHKPCVATVNHWNLLPKTAVFSLPPNVSADELLKSQGLQRTVLTQLSAALFGVDTSSNRALAMDHRTFVWTSKFYSKATRKLTKHGNITGPKWVAGHYVLSAWKLHGPNAPLIPPHCALKVHYGILQDLCA